MALSLVVLGGLLLPLLLPSAGWAWVVPLVLLAAFVVPAVLAHRSGTAARAAIATRLELPEAAVAGMDLRTPDRLAASLAAVRG